VMPDALRARRSFAHVTATRSPTSWYRSRYSSA
jgi:hypothetical protein